MWFQQPDKLVKIEKYAPIVDAIPTGIYTLEFDPLTRNFFLKAAPAFEMPTKIYGLELKFINKSVSVIKQTSKNVGIALVGIPGSGKTVTAKNICLRLPRIPVILVNTFYKGMEQWLAGIQQEVILFFDEFEKTSKNGISIDDDDDNPEANFTILSLMDGVFGGGRKIFLLTSNSEQFNSPLMNRPSRIRYLKKFDNLDEKVIREILDDRLKDKNLFDNCIEYFKTLKVTTVDAVCLAIEEVNLTGEMPEDFNLSKKEQYVLWKKKGKDWEEVSRYNCDVMWDTRRKGQGMYFGDYYAGILEEKVAFDEFIIKLEKEKSTYRITKIVDKTFGYGRRLFEESAL